MSIPEVTYQDIEKANKSIVLTDIKGKNYAAVAQRIKAFRMVHPQGKIATEMVSLENGMCVFKATVTTYIGSVLGTGYAHEKEGSSFINKTSFIENCETSAVGRALGMAGFGIDTGVASAEEIENAELAKIAASKIDKTKVQALQKSISNNGISEEAVKEVLKQFKYESIEDIEVVDYMPIISELQKQIKEVK
jgi:hypothetical protein